MDTHQEISVWPEDSLARVPYWVYQDEANYQRELQRLFEREQVVRIDDRGHALPHDRIGHRMDADLRHLIQSGTRTERAD